MRTSRLISRSMILAWLIAPCAAATLLACTQAEGDTCQVNRDCEDGLVCRREAAADRGVCVRQEAIDDDMQGSEEDPELPPDEPVDEPEGDAGSE
jgi:hypothetical protein